MSQPASLQRNTAMLVFSEVASCTVYSKCTNLLGLRCATKEASELLSLGDEPLESPSLPLSLKSSFRNLQAVLELLRETLNYFYLPCFDMPTLSSLAFSSTRTSFFLSWWLQFSLCSGRCECIRPNFLWLKPLWTLPTSTSLSLVKPCHSLISWVIKAQTFAESRIYNKNSLPSCCVLTPVGS